MRRQEDTDEQAIQSLPITNAYVALGILPPPKEKDAPGFSAPSSRKSPAARSQRTKLLEIEVERLRNRIAEMEKVKAKPTLLATDGGAEDGNKAYCRTETTHLRASGERGY